MRNFACILLVAAFFCSCVAQTKIHSHNDYQHKKPFIEAYEFRADQIEADVFLRGDSLLVAHSKKEINSSNTLNKLYLDPIASLFKKCGNSVSNNANYTFCLMIDVKENWNLVYPVLKKEIEKYGTIFDRSKNKLSIQIVISGERPAESTFHTYPSWLYFDGLPSISYAKEDFKRVTMISDNFSKYSKWKGVGEIADDEREKLAKVVRAANQKLRSFRFWGAPDNVSSWKLLNELGKVIINTDKLAECKLALKER